MNFNTDYMKDIEIVITITDKEGKSRGKKICIKCSNGAIDTRNIDYPDSLNSSEVNSIINDEIRRAVNFVTKNLNFK